MWAGGPSFREVAKGWGLCLTREKLAYTLSRVGLEMVGAVGIEIAVHLISLADSVALAPLSPLEMQLRSLVLWPRCGHFHTLRITNR